MKGAGRVVFTATLLLIVGTINILYGFGALDDANIFVKDTRYILDDLNTLGWVLIGLGVVQLTGGLLADGRSGVGSVRRDRRWQPGRDRRADVGRSGQPLVVARRLRSLRLHRARHHGVRRREVASSAESTTGVRLLRRAPVALQPAGRSPSECGLSSWPHSASQPRSGSCIARTPTIGAAARSSRSGRARTGGSASRRARRASP